MIYTNQWLIEVIKENWMMLILLYGIVRAMFPNSKMLTAIGEAFSNLFPVFRKKE
jgi:hypothetical protein